MSATTVAQSARTRSPLLGVVAFVLAVLACLGIPAIVALVGAWAPELVAANAFAVPTIVFGAIGLLAVFAALTGRGRGWAVAGLVVAVANPYSPVHVLVVAGVRSIFG